MSYSPSVVLYIAILITVAMASTTDLTSVSIWKEPETKNPIHFIQSVVSDQGTLLQCLMVDAGYIGQYIDIDTLPWYLKIPVKYLFGFQKGVWKIGSASIYIEEEAIKRLPAPIVDNVLFSPQIGSTLLVSFRNIYAFNGIAARILHWIIRKWEREEDPKKPYLYRIDYDWLHAMIDSIGDTAYNSDVRMVYSNGRTVKLFVNNELKFNRETNWVQFARIAGHFKKSAFTSTKDRLVAYTE